MLERDQTRESVRPVDLGLRWDVGAPLPHLLQSEWRTFLVFYLPEPTPDWDGRSVSVVDPASREPVPLGVIEWLSCGGAVLGGPNDEACHGHRLWSSGLSDIGWYRSAEVTNSQWIADLEQANRVHPQHRPERFASYRHFLLGFHDSTFECVAMGFRTWKATISMPEVLVMLARRLDDLGGESDPAFEEIKRG